jgi:hypothetical protein
MITMYEKHNDVLVRSLLLFVCGSARVKNIRVEHGIDREPLPFFARHYVCKNNKSRTGRRSGVPYFLYVVLHM